MLKAKQLMIATALKFNTHPAQLFKDAHDYAEIRINPDDMFLEYEKVYETDLAKEFVVNYCLDLWNGNIKDIYSP